MARQLAEEPGLGSPSGRAGVLTVAVSGDLFEDCPALTVGYIREPHRLEIRCLTLAPTGEGPHVTPAEEPAEEAHASADPAVEAISVREVTDAWQRIVGWLQRHAPESWAALRPGASSAAIADLEADLGFPLPAGLRALWLLSAGDDGAGGRGCLPGNTALMTPAAAAATYRLKMDAQSHQDTLNARRAEYERITVWRPSRIPVFALGPADSTSGLYLDSETGSLGRWSRYNEPPDEEVDTLVTYLEGTADALEHPAMAYQDKPGLVGGTLVWLSNLDAAGEDRWQPWNG
ncbi:hypothetical protein ACIQU5_11885 [Streptomyces sp. NPDC090306]|uniref:hypothetical protein n=1 Tax=Streptomyces sp. NPDC090306 TaxID=3365961 RepID=UPI0037F60034